MRMYTDLISRLTSMSSSLGHLLGWLVLPPFTPAD